MLAALAGICARALNCAAPVLAHHNKSLNSLCFNGRLTYRPMRIAACMAIASTALSPLARRLCGLAAALLALLAAGTVSAQLPTTPEEARRQLEEARRQLEEAKRRQATVKSNVVDIAREREQLNTQLIETAALIQRSEGRLSAIEQRISELEAQEKLLRGSLAQHHNQIAGILAVMQKMGRNPPPVMITQRDDALRMVRSAMLLAAAFPQVRDKALAISERINELIRVTHEVRTEGEKLRSENERLNASRLRLAGLMEARRQSLSEQQAELEKLRQEAAQIAARAETLDQVFSQLERAVESHTGLGAYEKARKAAAAAEAEAPAAAPAQAPPAGATAADIAGDLKQTLPPDGSTPAKEAAKAAPTVVAMAPPPAVELAPKGQPASFNPGRMQPAMPFSRAIKQLPFPVHGKRILSFGERSQSGPSKGIFVETRHAARVVSPADGWIVYASVFRNYGPLLIISTGEGYHVVLMGMAQIEVQLGQFVVAGEPVGIMPSPPRGQDGQAPSTTPSLYIEFRKDGRVINPDPWWVPASLKVQG